MIVLPILGLNLHLFFTLLIFYFLKEMIRVILLDMRNSFIDIDK